MKEGKDKKNIVASIFFLLGIVTGMLLLFGMIMLNFTLNPPFCSQSENIQSYNPYTGETQCLTNCGRYNSTALHTFSYNDSRWHCSCESEGKAVTLW